jgi:hypothetical protein
MHIRLPLRNVKGSDTGGSKPVATVELPELLVTPCSTIRWPLPQGSLCVICQVLLIHVQYHDQAALAVQDGPGPPRIVPESRCVYHISNMDS